MESQTRELNEIIDGCTECGNCVRQCAFLRSFGTPLALARQFADGALGVETIYSCSLCRLCDTVCPELLKPSAMFLQMRRNMVDEGRAPLKQHRRILAYEKWGLSGLFRLNAIPENASTVFFPGCALAGSRPRQTQKLLDLLRQKIPDLGIVLNCCAKPSHDLGRREYFTNTFGKLTEELQERGIDSIITACPSCHQIFNEYGTGFSVKTIYQILAGSDGLPKLSGQAEVTVHDPCSTRFEADVHQSVRTLARSTGCAISEMKHSRKRTLCCGEGGSACFVAPQITDQWAEKRQPQTGGKPVITYCAGCVQFLSRKFETIHIADVLLDPDRALSGKAKVSNSPFTYINRLLLKRKLKK